MKQRSSVRSVFVFLFVVALTATVAYHVDLVGRAAYAFERGKLQADLEHLGAIDSADVASIEKLSHAFNVIAEAAKPSVVHVKAVTTNRRLRERLPEEMRENFRPRPRTGTGSGVILDTEGHIVTNNHVVSGAEVIRVSLDDGRHYEATVIGNDPKTDLAVIKIDADRLHPATFGDSDRMKVGYIVLAIGSPFRLDHTVSHGIISALERHGVIPDIDYQGFLQTDAPINPGNSGGPLINTRGEVIGINTAIATESGGHQGVGFAIPSNTVTRITEILKGGKKVVRGYLGTFIRTLDPQTAESYGLPTAGGVIVTGIRAGPAKSGGVREQDIITAINGRPTHTSEDLQGIIAFVEPDTEVDLTIWRDGKEKHLKVRVGLQPKDFSTRVGDSRPRRRRDTDDTNDKNDKNDRDQDRAEPAGHNPFSKYGFEAESLSPQLRRRLGVDREIRSGVVVTDVEPTSQVYDDGLRAGHVITLAQGARVHNADQLLQAIEQRSDSRTVRIWVKASSEAGFPIMLRLK